jgi:hypothetical protein
MIHPTRIARRLAGLAASCVLACSSLTVHADAGDLKLRHGELKEQLRNNSYGRQLFIDSTEASTSLQGDVYAVLDHPFEKVKEALQDPDAWCDIMLLPFNTKACQANGSRLSMRIGRKPDQPVDQAYRIDFAFQNASSGADYFASRLTAGQGPFGTRDYNIVAEAVPIDGGKTFMHMRYAYGYSGSGRFAMQAYLATAGRSKEGFTTGGVRGAVERNAMRYYLAIDAYLDTMDVPLAQRVEKRANAWFSATERYPKQLREMDRGTYVAMKRQEYERQTTAAVN